MSKELIAELANDPVKCLEFIYDLTKEIEEICIDDLDMAYWLYGLDQIGEIFTDKNSAQISERAWPELQI